MFDAESLKKRFTAHSAPISITNTVRDAGHDMAEKLIELCPESRELSLAITKLEECVFWANAGIARN